MTPGEVRRLYFIIRTFLSYGLDELIPKMRITLPLRLWRYSLFWMPNRHKDKLLGERLRLALQELGPVWIKFGQMLSTRRDLFPPHIADQLALLQELCASAHGYDAYSFHVLPRIGSLVANDADSYRYLAESIRMHPDQDTLKAMMQDAGFESVDYYNLTAGVVALHRGYKF